MIGINVAANEMEWMRRAMEVLVCQVRETAAGAGGSCYEMMQVHKRLPRQATAQRILVSSPDVVLWNDLSAALRAMLQTRGSKSCLPVSSKSASSVEVARSSRSSTRNFFQRRAALKGYPV